MLFLLLDTPDTLRLRLGFLSLFFLLIGLFFERMLLEAFYMTSSPSKSELSSLLESLSESLTYTFFFLLDFFFLSLMTVVRFEAALLYTSTQNVSLQRKFAAAVWFAAPNACPSSLLFIYKTSTSPFSFFPRPFPLNINIIELILLFPSHVFH